MIKKIILGCLVLGALYITAHCLQLEVTIFFNNIGGYHFVF